MSVTVTIQGLDRWRQVLDPSRLTAEVDRAIQQAAQQLSNDTQNLPPVNKARSGWDAKGVPVAPKYGGSLRQSIHAQRLGLLAAGVVTGVSYGSYVHDGTSKMPARPYFQWLLEDFDGLGTVEGLLTEALERVSSP